MVIHYNRMHSFVLSCLFVLCFLWTSSAHSMEHNCRALFGQSRFAEAGACYLKLLPQVDKQTQLHSVHLVLKNRYIEQAAISYNRAARASQKIEEQGYFRERACQLLQTAIKQQYCKAANRCTQHRLWIVQLRKEVRYAPVTILTGRANADITLQGYKYKKTVKERFVEKVRPGRYVLSISHPKRTQVIYVKAGHSILINAQARQIKHVEKRIYITKKSLPPLALIGIISGAVLLAAGTTMSIYGVIQQNNLNQIRRDPVRNAKQTDEAYNREFDQAQVITGVGIIAASVGGALLLGSGLLSALAKPKIPPPSKATTLMGHYTWSGATTLQP